MRIVKPTRFATRTYLLVASFVVVVLLSPLTFLGLAGVSDADLSRMGNIGQAYGFASALISAAALFAVARSFAMQAKQSRAAEIQALRHLHAELIRLTFDYPDICVPAFGQRPGDQEYLRNLWRGLHLQYIVAGVEVGDFDEHDVREELAAALLATEAGRAWWGSRNNRRGRSALALVSRIFDEECQRIESRTQSSVDPATSDGTTNAGVG